MFSKKYNQNQSGDQQSYSVNAGNPEAMTYQGGAAESQPMPEHRFELQPNQERGERQKEQSTERNIPQSLPQQQIQQQQQQSSTVAPKVFGYKIPPQIATNFKLIKSNAGKGDPKTGIACLYVFLDRLLKMHQK